MNTARAYLAPTRRFAIVCPGFAADRVRRQPWHVADGLARGLAAAGHEAWVLSDVAAPLAHAPYGQRTVQHLFTRGGTAPTLCAATRELAPERVFLVLGISRLARLGQLDLGAPASLILTSPRLRLAELARLGPSGLWHERDLLLLPLLNALVPAWLLRRGLARAGIEEIVYLSAAARERLAAQGLPPGRLLMPQIEPGAIAAAPATAGPFTIGYFGPPLASRGADLAITAFEQATALGLDGRLLLLLRPDGEPGAMARLREMVARSPARARIEITGEMLPARELRALLARCHAFLLPFRITISEVPLVVIEACLSGRPTIVLDTPGVGEVARRLNGIVARSAIELPARLLGVAARPPAAVPPDPTPWTSWRKAAAELVQAPSHPLAGLRLVALAGVDGSGKTFLLRQLAERLDQDGIAHRHVWSRFRNYLSKPFLALTRLTGHNRKEEIRGVRIGYHEFAGRPLLALPFLALQLLDGAIDAWWRFGRSADSRLILADRCLYDTLIDLAVDTGLDELLLGPLGRWLVRRLPAPNLVVVLSRPVADIRATRPDALLDRRFARRRALYERMARELELPILDNVGSADTVLDALERLAAASPRRGAPS